MNASSVQTGSAPFASAMQGITQILAGVAGKRQADSNAKTLRKIGRVERDDARLETRRQIAKAVTRQAAGGGQVLADVTADMAREGEINALRAQFGLDTRASSEKTRGNLFLASATARGTGTILGGAQRALGRQPSRTSQTAVPTQMRDSFNPIGSIV